MQCGGLFKKAFIIGLALVFSCGWTMDSWAQPVKGSIPVEKGEKKVISQTEKGGQRDSALKKGQIVLIGASYTRGWNIEEIAGMKVINKGVNGNQSFEMLTRFQDDVIANKPKAVLIWGFINDIHRSKRDEIQSTTARAKKSIKEMVKLAKSNGIVPILGTELTIRGADKLIENLSELVGSILGKESYQAYVNKHVMAVNQWIKGFAMEQKILLLDFQPTLSDQEGLRKKEYATKDGTHISLMGYKILTQYLNNHLNKDNP